MTYDGTVTSEDPNLVTSFELDEQTTAYVVRDIDAQAPDWDTQGFVCNIADSHSRYDSTYSTGCTVPTFDAGDIRGAWDRFEDHELVGRYLRMWHDVVSVDYSTERDSTTYSVVTRAEAEAWGTDRDIWPDLAGGALDIIRQWREGEVYGVIVVNSETGEEDQLFDVYDSSANLDYCHTVAQDIAPIGVSL